MERGHEEAAEANQRYRAAEGQSRHNENVPQRKHRTPHFADRLDLRHDFRKRHHEHRAQTRQL